MAVEAATIGGRRTPQHGGTMVPKHHRAEPHQQAVEARQEERRSRASKSRATELSSVSIGVEVGPNLAAERSQEQPGEWVINKSPEKEDGGVSGAPFGAGGGGQDGRNRLGFAGAREGAMVVRERTGERGGLVRGSGRSTDRLAGSVDSAQPYHLTSGPQAHFNYLGKIQ